MKPGTLLRAVKKYKVLAEQREGNKWYVSIRAMDEYAAKMKGLKRGTGEGEYTAPSDGICPSCHRHEPACGWALPFQKEDASPVEIVCKTCFNAMLEAA